MNKIKANMQSKFETEIPADLKIETARNLSNCELVNLFMTSKYNLNFFQPLIDIRRLLHHVTRGEHNVVQAMLKKDFSLIFQRGVVKDYSGREFERVSPFEYALWALDKHMWTAMLACISSNKEGRKVFPQLITQYNKVNTDGVTYQLNGETITEQHFDFDNTIIKELQTQVDSINAPEEKNWDAIDKQWREGVGGAQKQLPMHVVYEYCSDEPFYPVPKFTSQPKSSKQFYNWITEKDENWFSVDSQLGADCAIYKGGEAGWPFASGTGGSVESGYWRLGRRRLDLAAMTALCKVRTNDFLDLKSQLEDQMTLDYHHHSVSQI